MFHYLIMQTKILKIQNMKDKIVLKYDSKLSSFDLILKKGKKVL